MSLSRKLRRAVSRRIDRRSDRPLSDYEAGKLAFVQAVREELALARAMVADWDATARSAHGMPE